MPAYNEAEGIGDVVRGFLAHPMVAEVLVADNGSTDGTPDLAERAGARVVHETNRGYGFASRRALLEAREPWVIITESDKTFDPQDVTKFAAYHGQFDVVFGTRTSKSLIWSGANMGWFLRYGNWAVAKYLEYLHNGPCLTDVGCTYRMLSREVIRDLAQFWRVGDSSFSPELMVLAIRRGWRCVEIPVNYGSRVGTSKITGSRARAFKLGCRMIWLVLRLRFRRVPKASAA
ncbi:MAG: glycosyltransferase family 2 protein [Gemmatimonas sp.]|nr:glycosyltransferase family 2 protein [Gemmatimonas sp.]